MSYRQALVGSRDEHQADHESTHESIEASSIASAAKPISFQEVLLHAQEERRANQVREAKEAELEAKNVLKKLPREIRDMIWRLLLRRQGTILPGYVACYDQSESEDDRDMCSRYGYRWDENNRPVEKDFFSGESSQRLTLMVPTVPTSRQAQLITGGESLPFTLHPEFGSQVGCEAVQRGEPGKQFSQIINRVEVYLEGLQGLSILRVNKQILVECREVLYGENSFAFDTSGIHDHDTFEQFPDTFRALLMPWVNEEFPEGHFPHLIPGMRNRDGSPQTPAQLNKAIDRIFVEDGFTAKFVDRDRMLHFFYRIGRVNASLLTKIKLSGMMKTVFNWLPHECSKDPLGLSQILNVQTKVLQNVCPNLRELTLHMDDKNDRSMFRGLTPRDDDILNMERRSDDAKIDAKIDAVVKKVVMSLTSIKILQLGGHKSFIPTSEFEDEWGRSARWMMLVKGYVKRQEAEKVEIRNATILEAKSPVGGAATRIGKESGRGDGGRGGERGGGRRSGQGRGCRDY